MIVVIDYGMGNLRSVSKALEHLGGKVCVSSDPKDLERADKMVLPGVGAFGDAMREIEKMRLNEPIRNHIVSKKPFLGICLGMQLLFESSEESPNVPGLGIFKGAVRAFPSDKAKVPHMGWNSVHLQRPHALFKKLEGDPYFYFVHSFYVDPAEEAVRLGIGDYAGRRFAAIIGNAGVFATQFHPEKSQEAGLQILKNFLQW